MNKQLKIIQWATALLVAIVATIAFVLSYNALWDTALSSPVIPDDLAWLWPLILDLSLVTFSLLVVNAKLQNESTRWGWTLVGVYTMATVIFNIVHASPELVQEYQTIVNWTIAVMAPIGLFFAFESLMGQLGRTVKRVGVVTSIEELIQQETTLASEVKKLQGQAEALRSKITTLTPPSDKEQGKIDLLALFQKNPDLTYTEAGEKLNRTRQTIGGYSKELIEEGRLYKNGNGWEVLA